MSLFANSFHVAVEDAFTRVQVKDTNTSLQSEQVVVDLVIANADIVQLANMILKLQAEHVEKMIAAQSGHVNGTGKSADGDAPQETVN